MTKVRSHLNTIGARALAVADDRGSYWFLAAVLAVSFALYAMFVQQTIRNVVARQALETEMSVLTTRIGELEFKYISMKNDVTIERAYQLGFHDVKETRFVSRKTLSRADAQSIH